MSQSALSLYSTLQPQFAMTFRSWRISIASGLCSGRKFGFGNQHAICSKQPILYVFALAELDLRHVCWVSPICSLDFNQTLANFSFMSIFSKDILHKSSNVPSHGDLLITFVRVASVIDAKPCTDKTPNHLISPPSPSIPRPPAHWSNIPHSGVRRCPRRGPGYTGVFAGMRRVRSPCSATR